MLNIIIKHGVSYAKNLYADPGDKVIDVYSKDRTKEENLSKMTIKIYEVGPEKVSHHCADMSKINVFDVALSRLSNVDNFIIAISSYAKKIIKEADCVHVEIEQ